MSWVLLQTWPCMSVTANVAVVDSSQSNYLLRKVLRIIAQQIQELDSRFVMEVTLKRKQNRVFVFSHYNKKNLAAEFRYSLWCTAQKSNIYTVQKMKFSIMDFLSKYDQIRSFPRIWSHLLKKSLVENIFCAVLSMKTHQQLSLIPLHKLETSIWFKRNIKSNSIWNLTSSFLKISTWHLPLKTAKVTVLFHLFLELSSCHRIQSIDQWSRNSQALEIAAKSLVL